MNKNSKKPLLQTLKQLQAVENMPDFANHRLLLPLLQRLGLFSLARRYATHTVISAEICDSFNTEQHQLYFALWRELKQYDEQLAGDNINIMDLNNRAVRLADLGLYALAEPDYLIGIEIVAKHFPENKAALSVFQFGLSTLYLRNGRYREGWLLYEARPQLQTILHQYAHCHRWQGEPLHGKTLLVLHEQGIGDTFQFIRYVIALKQHGVDLFVSLPHPICDFLAFNLARYGIRVLKPEGEAVAFDYYCSLLSLPYLMGATQTNIPLKTAYLTHNPAYSVRLAKRGQWNVGVVWASYSEHLTQSRRNIDLAIFSTLFQRTDIHFHCLQKVMLEQDTETVAQFVNVSNYTNKIHDFFDTAAIIAQLDLVITVDTAVAHLAAAMGRPTWILLNHKADFRWLRHQNDSVWYDSVRLFRQNLDYCWQPVIDEVYQMLGETLQAVKNQ